MEQDEVLAILSAVEATGTRLGVAGGWGVDALVGRPTRAHRDLALLVDSQRLEECLVSWPGGATRWRRTGCRFGSKSSQLARLGGRAPGAAGCGWKWCAGRVDRHPVRLPGGLLCDSQPRRRGVPCLTAARQRLLYTGYKTRPQDVDDLGLLTKPGDAKSWLTGLPGDDGRAASHRERRRASQVTLRPQRARPKPIDRRPSCRSVRGLSGWRSIRRNGAFACRA